MTIAAPLVLVALWGSVLIAFMVVRPSPYSTLFWVLIGSAMVFGGLYVLLSRRESRRVERETVDWWRQVNALVDLADHEDDGHLPEYLDETERRRVIEELERLPAGSRSLRRALSLVSPELLDWER